MSPFTIDAVTALGGPPWLETSRLAAWKRFETAALPTSALEEWRYSRIDELHLDRYRPWVVDAAGADGAGSDRPGSGATVPEPLRPLVDSLRAAAVVVVRNGAVVSLVAPPVEGVTVAELGAEADEVGAISGEPDALTVLNAALSCPVIVTVAPAARPAGPVVVIHAADADETAVFPRTIIRVGRTAEVSIVEIAWSSDIDALSVPVTEIDVADGARARYLHLQQLGPRVWQTGLQASRVGRDATLTSVAVALGGEYARLRTDSALTGAGGTTELLAVYFGTDARMVDFRTTQDHRAPKTTSRLLYKGAVANRSRAVYSGLIRVEKGAGGTNAFQTNRNLVLHEGAHAESVPNLEIEDNDVRCSHASAVGPISEDQRFYLESRGVPTGAADRLITLGFLEEVLDQAPVMPVAASVRRSLAVMLDRAEQLEDERTSAGVGR